MRSDWSMVQRKHILKACESYDSNEISAARPARNTFLVLECREYPAKFIRAAAYEIATGAKPETEFSGGLETVRFFKKRGFETRHAGTQTCERLHADAILRELSGYYAELQRDYRAWAEQHLSRRDVIGYLQRHNIPEPRTAQIDFSLLSSHWNPITIPILRIESRDRLTQMKQTFQTLFENCSTKEGIDKMWYLLYLIHPVRHELYYYSAHFWDQEHTPPHYTDHHSRLAWFLRSKRQGLKAAKTHFNRHESIDAYLGCLTSTFRCTHLHPATNCWQPRCIHGDKNLIVPRLIVGENGSALSDEEKRCAIILGQSNITSQTGSRFWDWIKYAPCSINEGPILSLKPGRTISDCFEEIVESLASESLQNRRLEENLSRILRKYHNIVD